MACSLNFQEKELLDHEVLAEALLKLPADNFDEMDEIMSRLSIQAVCDDVLEHALQMTNPGIVQIIETMSLIYKKSARLDAIRKWLIYGWPLFKDLYKSRKVN